METSDPSSSPKEQKKKAKKVLSLTGPHPYFDDNSNNSDGEQWTYCQVYDTPVEEGVVDWKNVKSIESAYPQIPNYGARQIPIALILDCSNEEDRFTVVNFWRSQSKQTQATMFTSLRNFYRAPRSHNEKLDDDDKRKIIHGHLHPNGGRRKTPLTDNKMLLLFQNNTSLNRYCRFHAIRRRTLSTTNTTSATTSTISDDTSSSLLTIEESAIFTSWNDFHNMVLKIYNNNKGDDDNKQIYYECSSFDNWDDLYHYVNIHKKSKASSKRGRKASTMTTNTDINLKRSIDQISTSSTAADANADDAGAAVAATVPTGSSTKEDFTLDETILAIPQQPEADVAVAAAMINNGDNDPERATVQYQYPAEGPIVDPDTIERPIIILNPDSDDKRRQTTQFQPKREVTDWHMRRKMDRFNKTLTDKLNLIQTYLDSDNNKSNGTEESSNTNNVGGDRSIFDIFGEALSSLNKGKDENENDDTSTTDTNQRRQEFKVIVDWLDTTLRPQLKVYSAVKENQGIIDDTKILKSRNASPQFILLLKKHHIDQIMTIDGLYTSLMMEIKDRRALTKEHIRHDHEPMVWEEHYKTLCEFKSKWGHVVLRKKAVMEKEQTQQEQGDPEENDQESKSPSKGGEKGSTINRKLVAWVDLQRKEYRKLQQGEATTMTRNRVAKLTELGVILDIKSPLSFEDRVREYLIYKANNNGEEPTLAKSKNDGLHRWIIRTREQYAKLQNGEKTSLTQAQVDELSECGFQWEIVPTNDMIKKNANAASGGGKSSTNLSWNDRLQEYIELKQRYGTTWITKNSCALGQWCADQRKFYNVYKCSRSTEEHGDSNNERKSKGGMSADRIAKLEAVGFPWEKPTGANASDKVFDSKTAKRHQGIMESTTAATATAAMDSANLIPTMTTTGGVIVEGTAHGEDLLVQRTAASYRLGEESDVPHLEHRRQDQQHLYHVGPGGQAQQQQQIDHNHIQAQRYLNQHHQQHIEGNNGQPYRRFGGSPRYEYW